MAEESEFKDKANSNKGTTVANNTPVGSAGQPFDNDKFKALKKEVPEGKANAIKRRMAKKKEMGKK
jgi:hypothetical protein